MFEKLLVSFSSRRKTMSDPRQTARSFSQGPPFLHRPLPLPQDPLVEAVGIQIMGVDGKPAAAVFSVYQPPNLLQAEKARWADGIASLLARVDTVATVIVGGDVNVEWRSKESAELKETLGCFNLHQVDPSQQPTHQNRLIDVMVARNANIKNFVREPPLEKRCEGHAALVAEIQTATSTARRATAPAPRWLWDKADWATVIHQLHHGSSGNDTRRLEERIGDGTAEQRAKALEAELWAAIKAGVPVNRRPKQRPCWRAEWMDPAAYRSIEKARMAWREWRKTGDEEKKAKAQRLRRKKKRAVWAAKEAWVTKIVKEAEGEGRTQEIPKRLKGTARPPVPPLRTPEGEELATDRTKADALRAQYKSVFNRSDLHTVADLAGPELEPEELTVTTDEVLDAIRQLKSGRAPGPDRIPVSLLKRLRAVLAPALATIFATALSTGSWPGSWKAATIVPVPKVPRPKTPSDYRPISLLNSFSKLFEGVILTRTEQYLRTSPDQFAFAKGCGTDDALLRLWERVLGPAAEEPTKPLRCAVVSLDARKAYDTISHATIIKALVRRQCPDAYLNIFRSFLEGRTSRVRVGESESAEFEATSGVPQGARLSPLLFAVAIDDVLHTPLSPGTHIHLYADDGVMVRHLRGPGDQQQLEKDIASVAERLGAMGLHLNAQKTQVMVVAFRPELRGLEGGGLRVTTAVVEPAETIKYLGITIDAGLTLTAHWATLVGRLRGVLATLERMLRGHRRALRVASEAVVKGALLYSLRTCPPTTADSWERVERLRRRQARLLLGMDPRDKVGPELLAKAGITSARHLAVFYSMRFIWSCTKAERRFGAWMKEKEAVGGRAMRNRTGADHHHLSSHLIHPRMAKLRLLGPALHTHLWNGTHYTGEDVDDAFRSLATFSAILLTALPDPTVPFRSFSQDFHIASG